VESLVEGAEKIKVILHVKQLSSISRYNKSRWKFLSIKEGFLMSSGVHKWRLLILVLSLTVICVFLISCSNIRSKEVQADAQNSQIDNSASEWSDKLILTFKENTYTVTKNKTNEIDKPIGVISYHGNGAVFSLYSIKNIDNNDKIAVKTKYGYLIAAKNKVQQ
jgi:hypothetical protein